eukprot:GEMP01080308.1.p1 GENE.GEMP01080308.1~~GEMP01080308.1.p1  ORF type:complete len:273 (+),score=61.51 GEMP01080308.1:71-889(+)
MTSYGGMSVGGGMSFADQTAADQSVSMSALTKSQPMTQMKFSMPHIPKTYGRAPEFRATNATFQFGQSAAPQQFGQSQFGQSTAPSHFGPSQNQMHHQQMLEKSVGRALWPIEKQEEIDKLRQSRVTTGRRTEFVLGDVYQLGLPTQRTTQWGGLQATGRHQWGNEAPPAQTMQHQGLHRGTFAAHDQQLNLYAEQNAGLYSKLHESPEYYNREAYINAPPQHQLQAMHPQQPLEQSMQPQYEPQYRDVVELRETNVSRKKPASGGFFACCK